MTFDIVRGDALHLPLPDASVDLVCTSPPYFGLRSYQDGGEHYAGQLGSEATPAEFVAALLAATAEMVRCLKPSGSIWVNLGDKYATTCPPGSGGSGAASRIQTTHPGSYTAASDAYRRPDNGGIKPKSLMGIPWRYALACIDDLGLILRAEVIWSKPNGLPESVTDRVRRSHEQWFHFTVRPRYYAAVDEIREPQVGGVVNGNGAKRGHGHGGDALQSGTFSKDGGFNAYREQNGVAYNPLGKLPGSVWSVPTQPLTVPPGLGVDHFAAFPMEWPRRIVRGWSPPGVCTGCGEGRRPVVDKRYLSIGEPYGSSRNDIEGRHRLTKRAGDGEVVDIAGYACACPDTTAPTVPAVVLDPFGGTGTTALVAHALGRHGISVDMSADYNRLATWRCNDPAQLAAALQVDKPEPVADGQGDLFEVLA